MTESGHRDLMSAPLWRPEDLGAPIPDSPDATSVAMPLWQHVIGYEEGDPEIVQRLACGYPRFVVHPDVRALFEACVRKYGRHGETCFAFPSRRLALDCVQFLEEQQIRNVRTLSTHFSHIHAVFFPEEAFPFAKRFWQHFGGIVSSRRARAALAGREDDPVHVEADIRIREHIGQIVGTSAGNVFLYPSGMAALANALAMVQSLRRDAKSIQLGFPYVDGLKIQTVRGPGAHFFPDASPENLEAIRQLVENEAISGVFCEVPSNPMLRTIDIPALSAMLRPAGVPLIVDDTIATFANVHLLPWADIVVSSLTKNFSGVGDVMAGSLIISEESPYFDRFLRWQTNHYENLLWHEDAAVLESNARDFEARMNLINAQSADLCQWLAERPEVERVLYPLEVTRAAYDAVKRPDGGYGGLLSIELKDCANKAPAFYDHLEVTKGPSLGMNYTMACPYTLLAHYTELEWVESLGISPHLVRVSVGMEPIEVLKRRFEAAFRAAIGP